MEDSHMPDWLDEAFFFLQDNINLRNDYYAELAEEQEFLEDHLLSSDFLDEETDQQELEHYQAYLDSLEGQDFFVNEIDDSFDLEQDDPWL